MSIATCHSSPIHTRLATFFFYSPKPRLARTVASMSTSMSIEVDLRQDTKNIAPSRTPQAWLPAQDHRAFEHSVTMDLGTTAPQSSCNIPQLHHQEQQRSRLRSRCRTLSRDDSEADLDTETRPLLHPSQTVVIDGIPETCSFHDPSILLSSPETDMNATRDFYALYNPPDNSTLWNIAR